MKTKDSTEKVRAFLSMIRKKKQRKNLVRRVEKIAGECKKLCKAHVMQLSSTRSDIKAAFDECTLKSLKNLPYRYLEDYGYKYIHKLT